MARILVDTSAILALLVSSEATHLQIEGVFAFDRHFTNQGFSLLH